jgi:hypothetical protein
MLTIKFKSEIMKTKLHTSTLALSLLLAGGSLFAQTAPPMGVASSFALFTSNGAVKNVGHSQITGNVGTNLGSSTGFGNVNGQMQDGGLSVAAASALNIAYQNLGGQTATVSPGTLLGGGQVLTPAVFSVPTASSLTGTLTLNGQNDPNACFVFQLTGAFSTDPGSKIVLINGAQACNVFWKITGATSMTAGTSFKGTIICDGAITLASGTKLEGRALSINGAVTVTDATVTNPIGCNIPVLNGPTLPILASTNCYALLSTDGGVSNTGVTHITGDVGTNTGAISGFNPSFVTNVHLTADASTAQASADLAKLYTGLDTLSFDIELLYPVQFGNSQVLTPHVYRMSSAAHLTDTIFLDAQGNVDAVFVIQITGALTTATYAKVVLVGGTKASNVFWEVEGAVDIADYSTFKGTIVANQGPISLFLGDSIVGRALSIKGAVTTHDVSITADDCGTTGINENNLSLKNVSVFPNPFSDNVFINGLPSECEVSVYNAVGQKLIYKHVAATSATIDVTTLSTGIYLLEITTGNNVITKKLVK